MPPLAWTFPPPAVAGLVVLAGGYAWGVARRRAQGRSWPVAPTVWWAAGVVLLALTGTSVVAVDDDVLFWARAVQGVVLLVVAPMPAPTRRSAPGCGGSGATWPGCRSCSRS